MGEKPDRPEGGSDGSDPGGNGLRSALQNIRFDADRAATVVLAILVVLSSVSVVLALTDAGGVGDGSHIGHPGEGPEIVLDGDAEIESQQPFPDSDTVALEPIGTFESDGQTEFTLRAEAPPKLTEIDLHGNELTIESNSPTVTLSGDVDELEFIADDGQIDVEDDRLELRYDASDPFSITIGNLEDGQGYIVVDGDRNELDSGVADSAGEVEFEDLPDGDQEISIIKQPMEIELRDETDPDSIVSPSGEAEITFFDDGEETVITRSTDDGTLNLTGLPTSEFTVQVDADGFVSRQTIIRSIFEQQEIYLLPDDEPSSAVQFRLDDPTGQFTEENSRIFIQRPIERDGDTIYRTVAADRIGADGYQTILAQDQRYRIEIENDDGASRQVGPYVATADTDTVVLDLDDLEFQFEDEELGYSWTAEHINETATGEAAIDVAWSADSIEDLSWTIVNRETGATVATDSVSGPIEMHQERYLLDDDEWPASYAVEWEGTINGEELEGSTVVGPEQVPIDIPGVDEEVLQLASVGLLLIVGGLFSAANVQVGAVVVSLFAGVLWFIGVLGDGVSGILIAVALLIAAIHFVRSSGATAGVGP